MEQVAQKFTPLQLIIGRDENGVVSLQGTLPDKVSVYGLLEVAHEAVAAYFKQQESSILPPSGSDMLRLAGR